MPKFHFKNILKSCCSFFYISNNLTVYSLSKIFYKCLVLFVFQQCLIPILPTSGICDPDSFARFVLPKNALSVDKGALNKNEISKIEFCLVTKSFSKVFKYLIKNY